MGKKRNDKPVEALELTDDALARVVGGVSSEAGLTMASDSRLNMGNIRPKPRIKGH